MPILPTILRAIRLLTMVFWVGSLLFFAFVLAPTAFHVLPSTHEAGLVVAATLIQLHRIGTICGLLFLVATAILWRTHKSRTFPIQAAAILLMLGITAYLQGSVLPRMERDRIQAGGNIDAAPIDNPARQDFERLHPLSEKLEGTVLCAGLAVILLMAVESRELAPKRP